MALDKSGNGEDYMKRARDLYMIEASEESTAEDRRKGKPVLMKKDIERFIFRLEAKRRAENLTTNNPKILDLYDELVTRGAYKMKGGKEVRIADTTSMWTANDYLKFKFQTDPEAKVQAEMDLMEQYGNNKTVVRQQSGSLGMAIDKEISGKDEYKRMLATPRLIKGDTVEAKADELQGKWEIIKGRPMNDAERLKLEATIRKGLDDDGG